MNSAILGRLTLGKKRGRTTEQEHEHDRGSEFHSSIPPSSRRLVWLFLFRPCCQGKMFGTLGLGKRSWRSPQVLAGGRPFRVSSLDEHSRCNDTTLVRSRRVTGSALGGARPLAFLKRRGLLLLM